MLSNITSNASVLWCDSSIWLIKTTWQSEENWPIFSQNTMLPDILENFWVYKWSLVTKFTTIYYFLPIKSLEAETTSLETLSNQIFAGQAH